MARDILKTLKTEHNALRELFKQMEATTDRAEKRRSALLAKIEATLLPHAKWEEIVFYPAFRQRADRDGLKAHAEALLEHAAVEETVIPNVKASEATTPEFAGRVKVFGEMIDHHAKEEETTIFRMARAMFSAQELGQLDEAYEAWKASPAAANAVAGAEVKFGVKAFVQKVGDTFTG